MTSDAIAVPAVAAPVLSLARGIIHMPAIIARRPKPPPQIETDVSIHRQPVGVAADWQTGIASECARHEILCPPVFEYLKATGLVTRCVFLSSEDGVGPLLFRYIGLPTRQTLGNAWADAHLGKPDSAPSANLADGIDAQYREAIEAGEPLLNRVCVTGLKATPLHFSHLLMGWRLPNGRRALLSAVELL
ncbi:hypothetical protein ACW7BJ_33440 [Azospirillum argentinense]